MKVRPLNDRILVKRLEEEETTKGGIIIPDSAKEKPQVGTIVLVGAAKADEPMEVKAGDVVNSVAVQVGGKGGGRPDMAQAGGTQPENLESAISSVEDWVRQNIGG